MAISHRSYDQSWRPATARTIDRSQSQPVVRWVARSDINPLQLPHQVGVEGPSLDPGTHPVLAPSSLLALVSSSEKYGCGHSTQLLLLLHLKSGQHKFESSRRHWYTRHSYMLSSGVVVESDLNPRSHFKYNGLRAKDWWYHQS